jgi:hypothetical protein
MPPSHTPLSLAGPWCALEVSSAAAPWSEASSDAHSRSRISIKHEMAYLADPSRGG